jgi:peptidoglycan/xylan/chitin deacetylase (PgdA/CDA1 family)
MKLRALSIVMLTSACGTTDIDQKPSPLTGTTIVSLTFDDTLADQYQVGELLAARGLVATFYVNSPRLLSSSYMTLDQVRTLHQQGNEIGGHTLGHVNLTTLSEADITRQVCDDRNALLAAGFPVTSFAYPYSADNETVRAVVKNCGYNSARDGGGLLSPSCSSCPAANAIPPLDPYRLRTNSSVQSTTTLADLQRWVTQAEENGGGFVPITFHHVCDGCSSNGISPALFAEFLDWLAPRAAQGTEVATVHQVIGGEVKPPVTALPAPGSNLLKNPSLETDANGDQMPDCWQPRRTGNNTATFTRTTDAANGSFAERIDVTRFRSGARQLGSVQDSGTCAPSVTPGHTYTMRASYIASTPPLFSVYYRTTSGTWVLFVQSPRLPTSSTYVAAQYTTPPLPADATAISIGIAITDVGFLVTDDYSLVEDQSQPPPPPPPDPSNLLQNPSLETDANGDQMPDCWRPGGSGTNTATFTRVTDAAHGSFAERIDVTSFTSGARRLVSVQDAGTCAPSATPGQTFTMRAAYMANTPPLFSVYYRTTAGTWLWLSQSPRLPTSSTYVTAQYTTSPLPADATAISIGIAITGVGFLVTDDYSLVSD